MERPNGSTIGRASMALSKELAGLVLTSFTPAGSRSSSLAGLHHCL
jgi:hypothetical protein